MMYKGFRVNLEKMKLEKIDDSLIVEEQKYTIELSDKFWKHKEPRSDPYFGLLDFVILSKMNSRKI